MKRVSSLFVRSPAAQRGLGHGVKVPRAPRAARPMSGGPGEKTRLWDRYQAVLLRGGAPAVLVKSLTASVIAGGGDIACQMLIEGKSFTGASVRSPAANAEPATKEGGAAVQGEEHREGVDLVRVGRFALLGAVLVAPTLHLWYNFLGSRVPGVGLAVTAKRVFCDQFLFAPGFIAVFFASLNLLEGKGFKELEQRLKRDWQDAVVSNWMLWIPAQTINLGLVPVHLQVLFGNFVGLGWNSILSWLSHRPNVDTAATLGTATTLGGALERRLSNNAPR